MKRLFVAIMLCVAVAIGASSCKRNSDLPVASEKGNIRIEKFEGLEHGKGLSGDLLFSVSNGMAGNVTISSGTFTLCYGDKAICDVELTSEVMLPKRVISSVRVPVKLNMPNPLAAYGIISKILRGDIEKVSLSYDVEAAMGPLRRRMHREGIPLKEAMEIAGFSVEKLNFLKK